MNNLSSMSEFLETELQEETIQSISYEQYVYMLECVGQGITVDDVLLHEGFSDFIKAQKGALKKIFTSFKKELTVIANEFKVDLGMLVQGFKNRNIFSVFKYFGFSLGKLTKVLGAVSKLWRNGLAHVFDELAKTGLMKKLHKGLVSVDEVLAKYPILKKLTGPMIAGLLIYIWLNMTFIGDLDYDFNFGAVVDSLTGRFTLADLFGGGSGLMLLTLFGTGGLASAPWLGSVAGNLALALVYTAVTIAKDKNHPIAQKIRSKVKLKPI